MILRNVLTIEDNNSCVVFRARTSNHDELTIIRWAADGTTDVAIGDRKYFNATIVVQAGRLSVFTDDSRLIEYRVELPRNVSKFLHPLCA